MDFQLFMRSEVEPILFPAFNAKRDLSLYGSHEFPTFYAKRDPLSFVFKILFAKWNSSLYDSHIGF